MAKHYANILDQILDEMSFDKVAQLDDVDYFNGSTHTAGGESAGFSWNEETGDVLEGNLPEVGEAHSELEDHTGIERPATKLPHQAATEGDRKCDDCGQKRWKESVGGRKLCTNCAKNARERKKACGELVVATEVGKTTVSSLKTPQTGKGVVGAKQNWHTNRQKEAAEDNDSILNEVLLDVDKDRTMNAEFEKKQLTDSEVMGRIDGFFKEGKSPRQIVARLQKMAEMELFNKTFAGQYLKTEAGKMGYNYLEPNAFMDRDPQTTLNTHENVKIKGNLASIRGAAENAVLLDAPISLKTASLNLDAFLEQPSLHREGVTKESQVRGFPMVANQPSPFDARTVAAMFKQGANLETIYMTGRVKVGSKMATEAVRTYIKALKQSKTAKVSLAQLDCSFLKGKLAAHIAIIGASKCASCTFRQGLACGLTGGTLISFPGMQAGVDRNLKVASTAKDGTHLVKHFDLQEQAPSDIDISEPERLEIDGSAAKADF